MASVDTWNFTGDSYFVRHILDLLDYFNSSRAWVCQETFKFICETARRNICKKLQ